MGGGISNSALIPGLSNTVRIGVIQRLAVAMIRHQQALLLRNFQRRQQSNFSPSRRHKSPWRRPFLHPVMPGSPNVGMSSSRGPIKRVRSSRLRVSHSASLSPSPVEYPGPSYVHAVSCNCFIYTLRLRKSLYLRMP